MHLRLSIVLNLFHIHSLQTLDRITITHQVGVWMETVILSAAQSLCTLGL